MPLKAVVETTDDLPEAVKSLYRAGDNDATKGKFVLDVEPVEGFALEHIEGLRNAFATTKTELEKSTKALEGYKGLPAASTLKDKLEKLKTLESIDPQSEAAKIVEARVTAALNEAGSKHKTEIDAATAEGDRLWGALNGALIASAAKDSITKEKGSPALLMPHIKARTKIDRATLEVTVLRDDGTPFYNNSGKPGTIDDLVADLKKHPDYGRAFEAPMSGSGAKGGGQGGQHGAANPWAPGSINITEQSRITKADPSRAAFLKASAGAR